MQKEHIVHALLQKSRRLQTIAWNYAVQCITQSRYCHCWHFFQIWTPIG